MTNIPCVVEWHSATSPSNTSLNGTTNDVGTQFLVPVMPAPLPYAGISHIITSRIVVGICGFGIIGNILTCVLLLYRRKKLAERRTPRTSESRCARSDVWCFIALSVSDFLFSFCLLPQWFTEENMAMYRGFTYMMMYERYESPIINTFVMSSTWLTVSMTVNRYLHLCHPIWAMRYLGRHCLLILIILSVIFSILFNLPRFWFLAVDHYTCHDPEDMSQTFKLYWLVGADRVWEMPYRWCYFVIGILMPLCSLSYSNTRIIMAVYRSRAIEQRRSHDRNVITRTLIFVVLFYVCLVSPAELLKFFEGPINGYYNIPGLYGLIVSVANILQAINFSCNFVPYWVLDKNIRRGIMQATCLKHHDDGQLTSQVARTQNKYKAMTSSQAPSHQNVHRNSTVMYPIEAQTSMEMTIMPTDAPASLAHE